MGSVHGFVPRVSFITYPVTLEASCLYNTGKPAPITKHAPDYSGLGFIDVNIIKGGGGSRPTRLLTVNSKQTCYAPSTCLLL